MRFKPIIIVAGEPNSVFIEIFLKIINKKKFKSPIILICSKKLLVKQSKVIGIKIQFNEIKENEIILKKGNLKKLI